MDIIIKAYKLLIKPLIIISILALFSANVFSENPPNKSKPLVPYFKDGKWGFCNYQKEIIISPQYDDVDRLLHSQVAVQFGDKWALFDLKTNRWLSNFVYDSINAMLSSTTHYYNTIYYKIEVDQKYGIMDTTGKVQIPCKFQEINTDGGVGESQVFVGKLKGKEYLLNSNGKIISNKGYDGIDIDNWVPWIMVSENGKTGYINTKGEEITPTKYAVLSVVDYSNEVSSRYLKGVKWNSKYGLINRKGTEIVPIIYDTLLHTFDGFAVVGMNNKIGCLDTLGNIVIPFEYGEIAITGNDSLILLEVKQNGKSGIISTDGKTVIPIEYEKAGYYANVNLIKLKQGKKYGVANAAGEIIIPINLDYISYFYPDNKRMIFKVNGKYGCYNHNGNMLVNPIYDRLNYAGLDLLRFEQNGKFGFLDNEGNVVIQPIFDHPTRWMQDSLIKVSAKGLTGCINTRGDIILPIIYDVLYSDNGVLVVGKENKYAIFSVEGEQKTPFHYDKISSCFEGSNNYTAKINNKVGIIDSLGNTIIPIKYSAISFYGNLIFGVMKNDKRLFVLKGGLEFWD